MRPPRLPCHRKRTRAALALLAAGAVACGPPADLPPNVVLIVVDTLRRDHLGCYGYGRPTSPNIDRLAAGGLRFERATSQAPWTTPSIGSLLSSRYPTEIGIRGEREALADGVTLVSETFQEAGWATGAVVSHSFCGSQWNFDQGFDSFDESNVQGHAAVTSEGVTDRALEFVAGRDPERPFFLWVHYFDPHFAWIGHDEFDFGAGEGYAGIVSDGIPFSELRERRAELGPADVEELHRYYDSEIAFTDHHIGRLLDALDDEGLAGNTVVVLTADHGEEFLDHGGLGHATTLYAELVGVPLIVRAPGVEPGVVERTVPLLDVFPTLCELTGLAAPPEVEGRSLLEPGDAPRPFFTETAKVGGIRARVDDRYKVVHRERRDAWEIYDQFNDSTDSVDLIDRAGGYLEAVRPEFDAWEARIELKQLIGSEVELTDEQRAELSRLGYVGDDDR